MRLEHNGVTTRRQLAIDIINEPSWRVGDTVATGLLKINPDFVSIKTPKNPDEETKFKPPNTSKMNA